MIKRKGPDRYDLVKVSVGEGRGHTSNGADFMKPWQDQISEAGDTDPEDQPSTGLESETDAA